MNRFVFKPLVMSLGLIALAGCNITLQSNQYNFVKRLFQPAEPLPEKNWKVRRAGQEYSVYAINHGSGTLFVNEKGLIVSFDGWQITELTLPGSRGRKAVVVNKVVSDDGAVELKFSTEGGQELATHTCAAWKRSLQGENSVEWQQQCLSGNRMYQNSIALNEAGQLTALRFVVEPQAPAMVVELAVLTAELIDR